MKLNDMEKNWIIHLLVRVLVYATVLFVCMFALMGCKGTVEMDQCYVREVYVLDKGCVYVIQCKLYYSTDWGSDFYFYNKECDYLELRDKITIKKVVPSSKK